MRMITCESKDMLYEILEWINYNHITDIVNIIPKIVQGECWGYTVIYWEEVPETPQDSVSIADFGIDEGNAA